jgi:hypothetical protein
MKYCKLRDGLNYIVFSINECDVLLVPELQWISDISYNLENIVCKKVQYEEIVMVSENIFLLRSFNVLKFDWFTGSKLLDIINKIGVYEIVFLMSSLNDKIGKSFCKITEEQYRANDDYKVSLKFSDGIVQHFYIYDLAKLIASEKIYIVDFAKDLVSKLCSHCFGSGFDPDGHGISACGKCKGSGLKIKV